MPFNSLLFLPLEHQFSTASRLLPVRRLPHGIEDLPLPLPASHPTTSYPVSPSRPLLRRLPWSSLFIRCLNVDSLPRLALPPTITHRASALLLSYSSTTSFPASPSFKLLADICPCLDGFLLIYPERLPRFPSTSAYFSLRHILPLSINPNPLPLRPNSISTSTSNSTSTSTTNPRRRPKLKPNTQKSISSEKVHSPGPKITAFQTIILSALGAPLIPAGGSAWSRLKSRMRRRREVVDCRAKRGRQAGK